MEGDINYYMSSVLGSKIGDRPIMHYFELPEHNQIIKAYQILNEFSGNSGSKLHYRNVVNMLYLGIQQLT